MKNTSLIEAAAILAEKAPERRLRTGAPVRFWHLKIWQGMAMGPWLSLLRRNGFSVAPERIPRAAVITVNSAVNSLLALIQRGIYGPRIDRVEIEEDPIFIVGHWRSGTTLLHELLGLDERHTFPDSYACFCPDHFLVSRVVFEWCARYLVPSRRPMDDMAFGFDQPQEDEFALCNRGLPSPYRMFAFPGRVSHSLGYVSLENVPPREKDIWKQALLDFARLVTLQRPGRLILKSPLHTARIDAILEVFPNAKFVHIVRNPYEVFASTVHAWRCLTSAQGMQRSDLGGFEDLVFETFIRMYRAFEKSLPAIEGRALSEVFYEDLITDPLRQMRRVYETLCLGGLDRARPAITHYAASMRTYRPNRHRLSSRNRDRIGREWLPFMARYGYR